MRSKKAAIQLMTSRTIIIILGILLFVGMSTLIAAPLNQRLSGIFNFLGVEDKCEETERTIPEYTEDIEEAIRIQDKELAISIYEEFRLCFPSNRTGFFK